MARNADPVSYAMVVCWVYFPRISDGVLAADDSAMREIEDALRIAQRSGDDHALSNARMTLGVALVHRRTAPERDRGQKLLAEVSEMFLRRGYALGYRPILDMYLARERARRGDRDGAISLMRAAVDDMFREGRLLLWGVPATGVLVETLLDRGSDDDVAEAEAAIERLGVEPVDEGLVTREIWLLRLRALMARALGDETAYRDYRDRYRDMARTLGFEGPRRSTTSSQRTSISPIHPTTHRHHQRADRRDGQPRLARGQPPMAVRERAVPEPGIPSGLISSTSAMTSRSDSSAGSFSYSH